MGRSSDSSPSFAAGTITPHDTNNITGGPCRAIYVGTTGDVNAVMTDGQAVLFKTVPVGIFPIQVLRINSTNTTASNLVALF